MSDRSIVAIRRLLSGHEAGIRRELAKRPGWLRRHNVRVLEKCAESCRRTLARMTGGVDGR